MHIVIRAEGNPNIGLGHIMRCYALAQTCQKLAIAVTFLCSQETSEFLLSRHGFASAIIVLKHEPAKQERYKQERYKKHLIPNNYLIELSDIAPNDIASNDIASNDSASEPWLDEIASCLDNSSVLVLDGYQFDYDYQCKLKQKGVKFAYFDDTNSFLIHGFQHQANLVINGAESALLLNYQGNSDNSILCLGNQYLLVRQEFHNLPAFALDKRSALLINFGGADKHNYTTDLLIALSEQGFCAPMIVVTGAAFQHQVKLKKYIEHASKVSPMPIQHIHDAQDMASIMQQSKLAVCAAGGTQFELLSCATPSILVVVADNQLPATLHAAKQDWCEMCDWHENINLRALAKQVVSHWQNEALLQKRYIKATQYQQNLSFDGGEKIIDSLRKLSVKLDE